MAIFSADSSHNPFKIFILIQKIFISIQQVIDIDLVVRIFRFGKVKIIEKTFYKFDKNKEEKRVIEFVH
jgi:hypothetical protein